MAMTDVAMGRAQRGSRCISVDSSALTVMGRCAKAGRPPAPARRSICQKSVNRRAIAHAGLTSPSGGATVEQARSPIPEDRMVRLASHARLATIGCIVASSLAAQSPPVTSPAADDPDVQGAERLFSAWMEGQIAYRGLPGIVVGVVSDQTLVWTKGFGYANVAAKQAMTPATKFRMA